MQGNYKISNMLEFQLYCTINHRVTCPYLTLFSETVGSFETKFHMKAFGRMGMKIYTNELGHLTKMATMPIYGKNL